MLEKSVKLLYNIMADYVLVAQLDRVSPSDGEGCGFDSRRVYQAIGGTQKRSAYCFINGDSG